MPVYFSIAFPKVKVLHLNKHCNILRCFSLGQLQFCKGVTINSLDWTTGLDYWTGQLDWTTGLDYTRLLDSTAELAVYVATDFLETTMLSYLGMTTVISCY